MFKNKLINLFFVPVVIVGGFSLYIRYINNLNTKLLEDLNRLGHRIKMLETDKTMQKIVALKEENALLRDELMASQAQLVMVCGGKAVLQKQPGKGPVKDKAINPPPQGKQTLAPAVKGNRGIITKGK